MSAGYSLSQVLGAKLQSSTEFRFRAPALKQGSWRLDLKDSRPNCLALVFCICKFNRI
jgi:hypothetical protein